MLSKKSYFKPALFWDDLRRFSPIWVCASLAMLVIPCSIWLQWAEHTRSTSATTAATMAIRFNELLLNALASGAIVIVVYAAIPAMALLSFLYQSRSALGIHALPTTRAELFLTHYAAGLAMMALPLLIFSAVTAPVLMLADAFWPPVLLTFCAGAMGMYLFFFSFAFFCGMFTGQLWGLPLFYAIFNGLASITLFIFGVLANEFLFGFYFSENATTIAQWLTPVWGLSEAMWCASVNSTGTFTFYGLGAIAMYALVGLGFAALALCIFHRRHLERAGEIVSMGVMRPVFILCLSLYGGFCAVPVFATIFSVEQLPWLVFFLVFGVSLGFAIGKMLLEKSIAILSLRNLKQFGAMLCLACLGFGSIYFDVLGYGSFIPEAEDVASVQITMPLYADAIGCWGEDYAISDSDEIALVLAAQGALIADYQETGEMYAYTTSTVITDDAITLNKASLAEADPYTYYSNSCGVEIAYTMTSGQVITRYYYVDVSPSAVLNEGSAASYLEALANQIDVVEYVTQVSNHTGVYFNDYTVGNSMNGDVNSSLATGALEAIVADLVANDTQMSVLRKYYTIESTAYLSMQYTEVEQGGVIYTRNQLSVSPRPGSYLAAYISEKVA